MLEKKSIGKLLELEAWEKAAIPGIMAQPRSAIHPGGTVYFLNC